MRFVNLLGHTFTPSLFCSREPTVIDCGANKGDFARICQTRWSAKVISYEADPALARALPHLRGVEFVNAAVAGRDGEIEVHLAGGTESSIRFRGPGRIPTSVVPAVSLDTIVQRHRIETIDLLKLDIEGAEIEALESASSDFLQRVGQITVEFHDFLEPADLPKVKGLIRRLASRFVVVSMSWHNYGDVLMINRNRLGLAQLAWLHMNLHKYSAGTGRIVRRLTQPRQPV